MVASLLRLMVVLSLTIFAGVACGTQEQGESEVRTVTETVTETVAASEGESGNAEQAYSAPEQSASEQVAPEQAAGQSAAEQAASEQPAPEDTLALQYQYINSGQYERAYELFASQSKEIVSLSQYTDFFEDNPSYTIDNYSFNSVDVQGDTAIVNGSVAVSGDAVNSGSYQLTQELLRVGGDWQAVMRDAQITSFTTRGEAQGGTQEESQNQPDEPASEPEEANVTVRVTGNEAFSGNYGTIDSSRTVDGVAPAEYSLQVDTGLFSADVVSAVMQKTGGGSGELGVEIVVDGEVVQETSTTAEYGVAQVSWTPGE